MIFCTPGSAAPAPPPAAARPDQMGRAARSVESKAVVRLGDYYISRARAEHAWRLRAAPPPHSHNALLATPCCCAPAGGPRRGPGAPGQHRAPASIHYPLIVARGLGLGGSGSWCWSQVDFFFLQRFRRFRPPLQPRIRPRWAGRPTPSSPRPRPWSVVRGPWSVGRSTEVEVEVARRRQPSAHAHALASCLLPLLPEGLGQLGCAVELALRTAPLSAAAPHPGGVVLCFFWGPCWMLAHHGPRPPPGMELASQEAAPQAASASPSTGDRGQRLGGVCAWC
jgi:hypothetical protein